MAAAVSGRDKVLHGRNGNLFLQGDRNDIVAQHTGRLSLDSAGLAGWGRLLRNRLAATQSANVYWLTHVAPDKEAVYADELPASIEPAATRPVHRIAELARAIDAPFDYGLDTQLEARQEHGRTYPLTDTHWNQRGAYASYRAICAQLAGTGCYVKSIEEGRVSWIPRTTKGSLGRKLDPPRSSPTVDARISGARAELAFDNRIANHGRTIITEHPDRDLPRALVFGESFTHNLLAFLAESFSRLIFVHSSSLITDLIDRERPDVVISLPLERFMIRVPDDTAALTALVRTVRQKVRRGGYRPPGEQFVAAIPRRPRVARRTQLGTLPWSDLNARTASA